MNSVVTAVLLTGFLATILIRVLKNDFTRYARADLEDQDEEEESGWKLVHGDVFRPPANPLLFASLVGSGMQLLCLVIGLLVLAGLRSFLTVLHSDALSLLPHLCFYSARCLLSHQSWCFVRCSIACVLIHFLRQRLRVKLLVSKAWRHQLVSLHSGHIFHVSRPLFRRGHNFELCCHFQEFLCRASFWHNLCHCSHTATGFPSSLCSRRHCGQELRQPPESSLSHKQNSQADSRSPLVSPLFRAVYYGRFPSFQRYLHRNFRTFRRW